MGQLLTCYPLTHNCHLLAGLESRFYAKGVWGCAWVENAGAALQPYRGTRPLLQAIAFPCRSGLVPR
ncbi:hypothetical protein EI693_12725 [Pseudomonas oryziphila]|uniref:Uncharacterized protein n=1 Tax=Pseudomonas oryziphila TaxID=2894079 RepID=A0ABN5TFL0_9PSED|nr:hypothetical protein EI693_12725 [Pseudomonas oryziphila]